MEVYRRRHRKSSVHVRPGHRGQGRHLYSFSRSIPPPVPTLGYTYTSIGQVFSLPPVRRVASQLADALRVENFRPETPATSAALD